jgi:hypothetical protein
MQPNISSWSRASAHISGCDLPGCLGRIPAHATLVAIVRQLVVQYRGFERSVEIAKDVGNQE